MVMRSGWSFHFGFWDGLCWASKERDHVCSTKECARKVRFLGI